MRTSLGHLQRQQAVQSAAERAAMAVTRLRRERMGRPCDKVWSQMVSPSSIKLFRGTAPSPEVSRFSGAPVSGCQSSAQGVCESLSRVHLSATPWTVAHQDPLSMGFSRQEHRSGLPFPSLGVFLTQGSNPGLLHVRQILYQGRSSPPCS